LKSIHNNSLGAPFTYKADYSRIKEMGILLERNQGSEMVIKDKSDSKLVCIKQEIL
jgi:hypothetical protein